MDSQSTRVGFPLRSLLQLYLQANPDNVYNEYFRGFKALKSWLSPIEIPANLPAVEIHRVLISYEIQQLAKIVGCSESIIYLTLLDILYPPSHD